MATSTMNNTAVEKTFSKKKYTRSEVALHNQPGDLWIIIYGRVYNVTKWADEHPGDRYVLQNYGGEDASVSRLYNNYYICIYLKLAIQQQIYCGQFQKTVYSKNKIVQPKTSIYTLSHCSQRLAPTLSHCSQRLAPTFSHCNKNSL